VLAALRDGRDPLITGAEGLATLTLLVAIEEAHRTGHAVWPAFLEGN
jgi:predicted dehydrogenase